MKYQQLSKSYRDDTLAEAMYSREVEHFHYDFDRINFKKLLEKLPDSPYRNNVHERLESTIEQMSLVELIYLSLASQITNKQDHEEAVARCKAKRDALANKGSHENKNT